MDAPSTSGLFTKKKDSPHTGQRIGERKKKAPCLVKRGSRRRRCHKAAVAVVKRTLQGARARANTGRGAAVSKKIPSARTRSNTGARRMGLFALLPIPVFFLIFYWQEGFCYRRVQRVPTTSRSKSEKRGKGRRLFPASRALRFIGSYQRAPRTALCSIWNARRERMELFGSRERNCNAWFPSEYGAKLYREPRG